MGFLGLENVKGAEFLSNINFAAFTSGIYKFFIIIALVAVAAGIVVYALYATKNKKLYNKKIFFFEEVNGHMTPVEDCWACELTIPNSNIKVFYIKSKNMYMPRPVKRVGKDAYWFCIKNNREIVNFTMKNLNEEMEEANLDYDHTDMRYANQNLMELIKRNYRDKSVVWWKEYKEIISMVIYIFVLTVAAYFILYKLGSLVSQVGALIDAAEGAVQAGCARTGSGVIMQ